LNVESTNVECKTSWTQNSKHHVHNLLGLEQGWIYCLATYGVMESCTNVVRCLMCHKQSWKVKSEIHHPTNAWRRSKHSEMHIVYPWEGSTNVVYTVRLSFGEIS